MWRVRYPSMDGYTRTNIAIGVAGFVLSVVCHRLVQMYGADCGTPQTWRESANSTVLCRYTALNWGIRCAAPVAIRIPVYRTLIFGVLPFLMFPVPILVAAHTCKKANLSGLFVLGVMANVFLQSINIVTLPCMLANWFLLVLVVSTCTMAVAMYTAISSMQCDLRCCAPPRPGYRRM